MGHWLEHVGLFQLQLGTPCEIQCGQDDHMGKRQENLPGSTQTCASQEMATYNLIMLQKISLKTHSGHAGIRQTCIPVQIAPGHVQKYFISKLKVNSKL